MAHGFPPQGSAVLVSVTRAQGDGRPGAQGDERPFRMVRAEGEVLVLAPVDGQPVSLPPPGAEVVLCWPEPGGEVLLPVDVAVASELLLARPQGESRVVQRRRFVRVRDEFGIAVRLPDGAVLARGGDLSEGGVRCELPATVPCAVGTPVRVRLVIAGWTVEAAGSVVHVDPAADATRMVGIDLQLADSDADRIRRHVFRQQVRELAERRRSGQAGMT